MSPFIPPSNTEWEERGHKKTRKYLEECYNLLYQLSYLALWQGLDSNQRHGVFQTEVTLLTVTRLYFIIPNLLGISQEKSLANFEFFLCGRA